jgi:histidinol-phosphate/aromatic aminotransferase/cobyric acid decarboxylase-like protein
MDDALRSLLRPELADLTSYVPADPPGIVVLRVTIGAPQENDRLLEALGAMER